MGKTVTVPAEEIARQWEFMGRCRERGFVVEHGEFGAEMEVGSLNHGPVTILFDTEKS